MQAKVICKTCKSEFENLFDFENTDQAYGCAAEVEGNEIRGAYGSTVIDGIMGTFPSGRPKVVKEGVICDTCIRNLMRLGVVEIQA